MQSTGSATDSVFYFLNTGNIRLTLPKDLTYYYNPYVTKAAYWPLPYVPERGRMPWMACKSYSMALGHIPTA